MNRVFLDTSYAIALSSKEDAYHHVAIRLADQLEADGTQLVTTRAVMTEIGKCASEATVIDGQQLACCNRWKLTCR